MPGNELAFLPPAPPVIFVFQRLSEENGMLLREKI